MNELETLRAEVAQLRQATKKALALAAHSLAMQGDAHVTLTNLMANYKAAMKANQPADDFDELATAMLLSLSSLALKQHPDDPAVQAIYRQLRPGQRH